jgi:hypothetical protein
MTHCKLSLITLIMLLNAPVIAQPAMNITFDVENSWNLNVHADDVTEAGNNYAGTYPSASNQIIISHDVTPAGQYRNHSWSIEVNKSDLNWHPLLELWIRRTANGSTSVNPNQCAPNITGGTNFQQLSSLAIPFYSGRCERSGVPIQIELRNASVLTPADTYSTEIVYTITITAP